VALRHDGQRRTVYVRETIVGPPDMLGLPRMSGSSAAKRAYGSGSLVEHRGAWYGKWRVGDRQVKRKLGPMRPPGSSQGLTRKQAEAALRRLMTEVRVVVPEERMTLTDAGGRFLHHVEHVRRRKASTVQD